MRSSASALTRKPRMKTAMKPSGRARSSTIGRIIRLTILRRNAAAKVSRKIKRGSGSTKEMPGKMAAVTNSERASMPHTNRKRRTVLVILESLAIVFFC